MITSEIAVRATLARLRERHKCTLALKLRQTLVSLARAFGLVSGHAWAVAAMPKMAGVLIKAGEKTRMLNQKILRILS